MSRIPVKVEYPAEMKLVFFPLAGLIIALIAFFSHFIFAAIFSVEITALLLLAVYVYLSGALHLDGLGDFFDAYFADRDQEKTIQIMHDSNSGVYAVVSLVLVLLLKYLLFKELLLQSKLEFILIMAVIARFYAALALALFEAAEASVWANSVKAKLGKKDIVQSFIVTFIILSFSLAFFGSQGLPAILLALILTLALLYYLANWSKKKIGGISGDLCGTIIELSELLILISAIIF